MQTDLSNYMETEGAMLSPRLVRLLRTFKVEYKAS
jgi:hypothetical protein